MPRWRSTFQILESLLLLVRCGNGMCCSSEQLSVGSEFGTDLNNGYDGDRQHVKYLNKFGTRAQSPIRVEIAKCISNNQLIYYRVRLRCHMNICHMFGFPWWNIQTRCSYFTSNRLSSLTLFTISILILLPRHTIIYYYIFLLWKTEARQKSEFPSVLTFKRINILHESI